MSNTYPDTKLEMCDGAQEIKIFASKMESTAISDANLAILSHVCATHFYISGAQR